MRIFNFGTQLFQRESISIGFEFSQRHPYRYITIRIRIRFKKRVTRFTYFTCNRPIFQKKKKKERKKKEKDPQSYAVKHEPPQERKDQ